MKMEQLLCAEDYDKERIKYLEELMDRCKDNEYIPSLERYPRNTLRNVKWMSINILIEAFINYHALQINEEFVPYMHKLYLISQDIMEIIPRFRFRLKEEVYRFSDKAQGGYIVDDLPVDLLQGVGQENKTYKEIRLQYFSDLLYANFYCETEMDKLNDFLMHYCEFPYKLEWINYCIVNSYLAIGIYNSANFYWRPRTLATRKYFMANKYYEYPTEDPLREFLIIFKKNIYKIIKYCLSPALALYFWLNNEKVYTLIFTFLVLAQLVASISNKNEKIRYEKWLNEYAHSINSLIEIKMRLNSSVMDVELIIKNLLMADKYKEFQFDNLISFLKNIQSKTINPINRVTFGLMKDSKSNV
ncbi:hypothetical protein [Legionella feeleii]|uniref:Uncharacterized protein n=1 Tax=Legionella feeleii TaxID=453 RepID=A0A378KKB9_9GAMM|nr:hypothetical protein [Legionella feeleii]STX88346.1 Uncharacterised protein [Legionella feeleii]